jgi:hypothetical protein
MHSLSIDKDKQLKSIRKITQNHPLRLTPTSPPSIEIQNMHFIPSKCIKEV